MTKYHLKTSEIDAILWDRSYEAKAEILRIDPISKFTFLDDGLIKVENEGRKRKIYSGLWLVWNEAGELSVVSQFYFRMCYVPSGRNS